MQNYKQTQMTTKQTSRAIKFRIWDKQTKRFIENPSKRFRMAICPDDGGVYSGLYDSCNKERYIIQQFTGFIDKNGKEIYEGDILKFSLSFAFSGEQSTFVEVKWSLKMARWVIPSICVGYPESAFIEVVGNIFETPDLCCTK